MKKVFSWVILEKCFDLLVTKRVRLIFLEQTSAAYFISPFLKYISDFGGKYQEKQTLQ